MAALPPRHGTEEALRAGSGNDERGEAPNRRILVVLDNCEHLLPVLAQEVAGLLGARTDVSILATSREPLRLRWEHRLPVRPLLQVATVRAQVPLSLFTDFESFAICKPEPRRAKELHTMLDQLIAWGSALWTIRSGQSTDAA
jgi:predicted ATPase